MFWICLWGPAPAHGTSAQRTYLNLAWAMFSTAYSHFPIVTSKGWAIIKSDSSLEVAVSDPLFKILDGSSERADCEPYGVAPSSI